MSRRTRLNPALGTSDAAAGFAQFNPASRELVESAAGIALQVSNAGLANRDNAPFVVVHVGDSLTEGSNSSSRDKRWTSRFRELLRLRFPTTGLAGGGFGFLAPYFVGTSMGNAYTSLLSGVPATDNTFGWGRRSAKLASDALGYVYTVTGTSIDLCYVQASAATSFTYSIDGAAAVTVNVGAGVADGKRTRVSLGASGSHTVTVRWASGTNVFFTGLMVYDGDESKGIQTIESGHFGWTTTDWVTNPTYWPANFTAQPASLVTIGLMANDYKNAIPSATSKANMLAIIAAIRAKHTISPSFVLVAFHNRGDAPSPVEPWANYVKVAYDIAAADTGGIGGASGVTVFDASRRLPTPGATGTGDPLALIASDHVHFTDKGSALFADALVGFIAPH